MVAFSFLLFDRDVFAIFGIFFFVEVPFFHLFISSMLQSRDDLLQGFSDESADDELENLLRRKLNKSKYFLRMKICPKRISRINRNQNLL